MGKVVVAARIDNLRDVHGVDAGVLRPEEVRHIEVPNALVDADATMLSMPGRLIEQLGLWAAAYAERAYCLGDG